MSKSKALVIGAGLGGLTSAAKLAQTEDYDVTVYERMSFAGGRFTQHDHDGYQIPTGAVHMIPHGKKGPFADLILGKKSKGILPIVSNMPKDNHSLMQLYLDGTKNNFYTLFDTKDKGTKNINSKILLQSHSYLDGKSLNDIKQCQFNAIEKVFEKRKLPHRSFLINKRNEETLGELFSYFMLETAIIGKLSNLNPYNQPAVEEVKINTRKLLI